MILPVFGLALLSSNVLFEDNLSSTSDFSTNSHSSSSSSNPSAESFVLSSIQLAMLQKSFPSILWIKGTYDVIVFPLYLSSISMRQGILPCRGHFFVTGSSLWMFKFYVCLLLTTAFVLVFQFLESSSLTFFFCNWVTIGRLTLEGYFGSYL